MTTTTIFDAAAEAAQLAWLRDDTRTNPDVLSRLESENAATDATLAAVAPLRDAVAASLAATIGTATSSVRVPDGPYEYWTEREAGADYGRHLRRLRATGQAPAGPVEVILDEQALAGDGYFAVEDVAVSDDHARIAWSEDRVGDEKFTIIVAEIGGAELLRLPSTDERAWSDTVQFNASGTSVLVLELDDTMRTFQVVELDIATGSDRVLYTEVDTDEKHWVRVSMTSDQSYAVIHSSCRTCSEVHLLDRLDPQAELTVVSPRSPDVQYSVDSYGADRQLLATVDINQAGITVTSVDDGPARAWPALWSPPEGVTIADAGGLADGHLTLDVRVGAFPRAALLHRGCHRDGQFEILDPPVPAGVTASYVLELPDRASTDVWVVASGYALADTVYSRALCPTGDAGWTVQHVRTMASSIDLGAYESGSFDAVSADGTLIPVSWMRRTGIEHTGILLTGYGAYGLTDDPAVALSWLPLADRGAICAVAHVRGGGDLGSPWYTAGRLENKPNSFADFVASAEACREQFGLDRVVAHGGSAGGLLVGASLNMRPDLFAGVVADVPFVDCLATMSDPTLPLTVEEYPEWGNPADPEAAARIAGYAPVLNVTADSYPPVLATCGLNDPRVAYWEPAKWISILRAGSTSAAPMLLRTHDTGHGGASGLTGWAGERAEIGGFILGCLSGAISR